MKVVTFKKRVDDFKTSQKSFEDWRCEDGSIVKEKIMGRVSALSRWDLDEYTTNNNYSLLNCAASVNVSHNMNKFTNFRTARKRQGLLFDTGVILIKGWGEISLALKIGNRTSILILKEVAYVSNFLWNLVSLSCLEDEGFRWHHWSGKIRNQQISQIIGSILRRDNNYEIGKFDTGIGTAFVTLAIRPQSRHVISSKIEKKNDRKRKELLPSTTTPSSLIMDKETARSHN